MNPKPLIVRPAQMSDTVGLSLRQIYRMVSLGTFPPPIQLNQRATGWRYADLETWMKSRETHSMAPAVRRTAGVAHA